MRTRHISLVQLLHRPQACKRHTDHGCMFGLAGALLRLNAICQAHLHHSQSNLHVCHAKGGRSPPCATGSHRWSAQSPQVLLLPLQERSKSIYWSDIALNWLGKQSLCTKEACKLHLCQNSHTGPHPCPRSCTCCHAHRVVAGIPAPTCANMRSGSISVGAGPQ